GNSVGNVRGSFVWYPATNQLTFVKTGGILAADTYHVTLVSGATAFHDTSGSLLDGEPNGVPGGNYLNTFVVPASANRVVSIKDFARGPGQTVDDFPATSSKLAATIDNANSVVSVDFHFLYDTALLSAGTATIAPGLPGDWGVTYFLFAPGQLNITAS